MVLSDLIQTWTIVIFFPKKIPPIVRLLEVNKGQILTSGQSGQLETAEIILVNVQNPSDRTNGYLAFDLW